MITLNGDSPMTISEGHSFTDPGAFSDDGSSITVTGAVDPDVPGTYTLTYIAVDEAGNVGTATRDVIVTPVGKKSHKNVLHDHFIPAQTYHFIPSFP